MDFSRISTVYNVALFGQTAKQWKNNNPGKKGNVRDDANLNQLLVLANMESYNAILIEQGKPQSERLILLRNLAIRQMDTLASINLSAVSALPGGVYKLKKEKIKGRVKNDTDQAIYPVNVSDSEDIGYG